MRCIKLITIIYTPVCKTGLFVIFHDKHDVNIQYVIMRKICAICEQNMSSKQLKMYNLDLTVGTINI